MEPHATIKQIQNTNIVFNFIPITTLKNLKYHIKASNLRLGLKSFEAGWVKVALFLHWHQLFEKCAEVANNSSYTFLQILLHYIMTNLILDSEKKSFGINFSST